MLEVLKMKWQIILFVVVAVYWQTSNVALGVNIDNSELLSELQPLYLIPGTLDFWPHNKDGQLEFKQRKVIDLYCKDIDSNKLSKWVTAYYISHKQFRVNGQIKTLGELTCINRTIPAYSLMKTNNSELWILQIGFDIRGPKETFRFKPIYEAYFDVTKVVTKFVKYELRQFLSTRPPIRVAFIGAVNREPLHLDRSFYSYYNSSKLTNQDSGTYNKGHLAAAGDFLYGVEQTASYTYPNAAPQLITLNEGTWKDVEIFIRNHRKSVLECYAGVLGVLKIDNKETYLDEEKKKIPVPEFFFKVAYDRKTENAIVFVGINQEVTEDKMPANLVICNNIINQLINTKLQAAENKNVYACEYPDFKNNTRYDVSYMPDLDVKGLLFRKKSRSSVESVPMKRRRT